MFSKIVAKQLDVVYLQFVFGDLMILNPGIGRRVRLLVSWVTNGCPSDDRNAVQTYGWVCVDLKVFLDKEINWSQVSHGDPQFDYFFLIEEIDSAIKDYLSYKAESVSDNSCKCG